jgi:hypothetical protein
MANDPNDQNPQGQGMPGMMPGMQQPGMMPQGQNPMMQMMQMMQMIQTSTKKSGE